MSKKCLDCAFFEKAKSYCYLTDDPVEISASSDACPDFKQRTQTVFQQITASPEVLAVEFVGMMYDRVSGEDRYYSMFTGEFYNSYAEAIAATVAKLKEVEK